MYRFYGDEYEGDEGAINLTSMAPRDENRVPKGVTVTELREGAVDFEGGSDKKLKYDTPSMAAYDITEYLSHEELALIAGVSTMPTTTRWTSRRRRGTTSSSRPGTPSSTKSSDLLATTPKCRGILDDTRRNM